MSEPLALEPGPRTGKPRTLLIGTGLATVAGTVFFGTLLAVYGTLRDASGGTTDGWVPDGVLFRNAQLVFTLLTLFVGAIAVHWAHQANEQRAEGDARVGLVVALLFGALHVNMVLYAVDSLGVGVGEIWTNLVFTITGAGIALSGITMLATLVMTLRVFGGQVGSRNPGLGPLLVIWWFQFAAWFALFLVVYAVK